MQCEHFRLCAVLQLSVVAAAGEEGAAKLVNGKNAELASLELQNVNPTDAQNVRAQAL